VTVRYPWPTYVSPLRCELGDVRIDGEPPAGVIVDADHLRLRLDRLPDWRRIECTVTVGADEPPPAGVDGLHPYVLASSTPTTTRLPFRLQTAPDGSAVGRLDVMRSSVSAAFTVQAHAGAHVAGQRRAVGASDPWTVVLEPQEAPTPPGAPPFEITWIDFAGPEAPHAARQNPTAHALRDLSHPPRLLLNKGIDGLEALLYNQHAQKERRRVRDVLSTSIVRYATATMFRAAAAEVVSYDGAPQHPRGALLRQTCEAVAEHMPGIGSVEELYERLAAATDSPLASNDLWTSIDLAVDALSGSAAALSTAAREVAYGAREATRG
jgi:hypothetical protein